MLAWRRHGPVVYRLRALFAMVMTLLATCVLALVSLSVLSLYPGAGAIRPGASEQPVRATVKECHRVGPLSGYGMGYWWICQAAVRHDVGPEYVGSMPAVVGYRAQRWAGTRMHVFAVAAQADRVDEERLRAFSDAVVNLALTRTGDSRGVQTVLVLPILITESADAAATSLTRTAYRLHLAGVAVLAQPAVADVRARKVWAFRGTRSRGHAHHSLIAEKYVIYLPEPAAR